MIGVEIKIDPAQFGPELVKLYASKITAGLNRVAPRVRTRVRQILRRALENSKEYLAMFMEVGSANSFGLRGELGLENNEEDVGEVVNAVVGAVRIEVIKAKANWFGLGSVTDFGGLKVQIIPEDLGFLLGLDASSYISESSSIEIEWLKWLLYSGTKVIISDYYVMYSGKGSGVSASRTDDALMVPSGRSKRNFKIRSTYAGTAGNNWITRAGVRAEPAIRDILIEEIKKEFA